MPNYLQRVAVAGASIATNIRPTAKGAPALPPSPALPLETPFQSEEPPEQSAPVSPGEATPPENVPEARPVHPAPLPAAAGPPSVPLLDTVVGAIPTTVVRVPRAMRTGGVMPVASNPRPVRAEDASSPSAELAPAPEKSSLPPVPPVEAPAAQAAPAPMPVGGEAVLHPIAREPIRTQASPAEGLHPQPEILPARSSDKVPGEVSAVNGSSADRPLAAEPAPLVQWIEKPRADVHPTGDPVPRSPTPVEITPTATATARPPEAPAKPVTDLSPAPAPNVFPLPLAIDRGEPSVISIGQVAVEVYNDPPQPAARPVERRMAATDPLEARFLGRLRWKL